METIDLLKDEYNRLRDEHFQLEARNDRIISLSITVTILAFAYGFIEEVGVFFITLPFLLYVIGHFSFHHLYQMYFRRGCMTAIESEINNLVGREILFYAGHSIRECLDLRKSHPSFMYMIILLVYALAIISYAHVYVKDNYEGYILVYLGINILILLTLAYSASRTLTMPKVSLDYYKERFSM